MRGKTRHDAAAHKTGRLGREGLVADARRTSEPHSLAGPIFVLALNVLGISGRELRPIVNIGLLS